MTQKEKENVKKNKAETKLEKKNLTSQINHSVEFLINRMDHIEDNQALKKR